MESGREIITLQLGHYSNFVGAHWWNIQDSGFEYNADSPSEINHDILYREGQTSKGYTTFTPRLLLVDLKGSLSHLPEQGELYESVPDPSQSQVLWAEEKVDIIQVPREDKNEFLQDLDDSVMDMETAPRKVYNLEKVVNVWSDYLRTRYHPKTVTVVNEYQHGNDTLPFDIFNYGTNLWKKPQFEEDFTDQLRSFVEECDNMQGFHILMDSTDGFAGLGTSAIQYLEDEYASKGRLAFPTLLSDFPGSTPTMDSIRTINLALAFESLADHSSLFVPLSTASQGWRQPGAPRHFQHLNYNHSLPYHSSAILAVALETLTLRYRLRAGQPTRMFDLTEGLGRLGRRAAAASLGLPFAVPRGSFLLETLEHWDGPLWQSLTPHCKLDEDRIWIQAVALRGVPHSKLRSPERATHQDRNPAYTCTSVQEMLALFLSCCSYATASQVTTADVPVKVAQPFPQIFSEFVQADGSVDTTKRLENQYVETVPAIAGIHSTSGVGDMLETLHTQASRLQLRRFHHFTSSGLEEDEFRECLDRLLLLRECYHEEFDV